MILSLTELILKYKINIRGVFHIGGHTGQEAKTYNNLGIANAIFFEPSKNNYHICKNNVEKFGYKCYNLAMGSKKQLIEMYTETANSGMSSSLLKPKAHLIDHPGIVFNGRETVEVEKLDNIFNNLNIENFNTINMDVQGYELEVLKGSKETLKKIDYIYTEVNRAEMYEDCAMIEDLDNFLTSFNFKRVETEWFNNGNWGDAFYIKGTS